MSEWWTYAPSDFLMFSPRVYYRLFEFYNRSFWPVAVVSLSLGIGMFLLLLRPTRVGHRIIPFEYRSGAYLPNPICASV